MSQQIKTTLTAEQIKAIKASKIDKITNQETIYKNDKQNSSSPIRR
jgi:hypothetical protein